MIPELVYHGTFHVNDGEAAVRYWLEERHEQIDAVLVSNDVMAIGTVKALQKRGIAVPEEIAVVGFDDMVVSQGLFPALTTIRQPLFELGSQRGAAELFKRIHGEDIPHKQTIPTQLIVRRSCGCSPFIAAVPSVSKRRSRRAPISARCSSP